MYHCDDLLKLWEQFISYLRKYMKNKQNWQGHVLIAVSINLICSPLRDHCNEINHNKSLKWNKVPVFDIWGLCQTSLCGVSICCFGWNDPAISSSTVVESHLKPLGFQGNNRCFFLWSVNAILQCPENLLSIFLEIWVNICFVATREGR